MKSVVLNFHHALEVLFKHILFQRSRLLIYKNINDWFDKKFQTKQASVKQNAQQVPQNEGSSKDCSEYIISFEDAVKRVIVICDCPLGKDIYNTLMKLNTLRNALTHDERELNKSEVTEIIVTLIPVVTNILEGYLQDKEAEVFHRYTNSDIYELR